MGVKFEPLDWDGPEAEDALRGAPVGFPVAIKFSDRASSLVTEVQDACLHVDIRMDLDGSFVPTYLLPHGGTVSHDTRLVLHCDPHKLSRSLKSQE